MDGEVEIVADLGEVGERGLSAVAEAEGFTFMHFDGVKAFVKDILGKLRSAPETEFVEGKDDGEVDASLGKERELVRERRDERKVLIGKENVRRMRIEGDSDRTCT